jgi:hypothetical protein
MSGGKIRTLVQILHFGAGESLVTARWLSGFTIQIAGVPLWTIPCKGG